MQVAERAHEGASDLSLYDLEETYRALLEPVDDEAAEDAEGGLTEEQRLLLQEVVDKQRIEKRDALARFLVSLRASAEAIKAEKQRLGSRQKAVEARYERISAYVLDLIRQYAPEPAKGTTTRRLEGRAFKLCAQANSNPSVVVDESKLSDIYKRATIQIPVSTWNLICNLVTLKHESLGSAIERETAITIDVPLDPLAKKLKAGHKIEGARLETGEHLRIR